MLFQEKKGIVADEDESLLFQVYFSNVSSVIDCLEPAEPCHSLLSWVFLHALKRDGSNDKFKVCF